MGLPKHRIDAEMVYISKHDTAWDHERIAEERAALGRGETHAWDEWQQGETRYDEATLPVDYLLDGEASPVKFRFRRIERAVAAMLRDQILNANLQTRACLDAFQVGVKLAENLDTGADVIDWPGQDRRKRLSTGDMDALERHLHWLYMADVGLACIRANCELREPEKKV